MKRIVIIDGYSLFFRAYHATAYTGNYMHTSTGVPTNAIVAFSNMMFRILNEHNFSHLVVALDPGGKTFRHELMPEYKGTRAETPTEMIPQFNMLPELLDALNIPFIKREGYEADDVIGTLAEDAEKSGFKIDVLTSDRDMLQLIDTNTTIRLLKKGLSEIKDMNAEDLMEEMGIVPAQVTDMKGLMGDSADNIPGVPGIGPKTATMLLTDFETLEGVYEHIDDIKGKRKENLIEHKDQAFLSKKLATITCCVDLGDVTLDSLAYSTIDLPASQQFFRKIEANSLVKRSQTVYDMQVATEVIGDTYEMGGLLTDVDLNGPIELATKDETFTFSDETVLYLEHPYENYHIYQEPLYAVIVTEEEQAIFDWNTFKENEQVVEWLADDNKKKIVFDSKKAYCLMAYANLAFKGVAFDVQLASYVINPVDKNDEVADIANNLEHALLYQEHVYGKNAKFSIEDRDAIMNYAIESAVMVQQCSRELKEVLGEEELEHLFYDVELPLAKVLADMELTGVRVDKTVLEEQGTIIEKRIKELETQIYECAGETFNISSPKQLGVILFEKLKLPVIKKTKTGYSTDAKVLEALQGQDPIIDYIGEYRQMTKLNSTYIKGLIPMIMDDGKIHTIYRQAQTQTGRLSSIEPNLQNIPIRLPEGKLVRKAFIPDTSDNCFIAADYSQIELRVLAELAGVEALTEAFVNGRDIHTETAQQIFGLASREEVTPLMRSHAKAVNFGIIYGMSDFGLATQLKISRGEAKMFIERYFELFPGIKDYMDKSIKQAEKDGYVETVLKRRRYFPTITSRNFNERNFAKRAAMNAPIQGSAADILKLAMITIDKRLSKENMESKMILQVHDELIFDVVPGEQAKMDIIIEEEMTSAFEMNVPLKVEITEGSNWYEV